MARFFENKTHNYFPNGERGDFAMKKKLKILTFLGFWGPQAVILSQGLGGCHQKDGKSPELHFHRSLIALFCEGSQNFFAFGFKKKLLKFWKIKWLKIKKMKEKSIILKKSFRKKVLIKIELIIENFHWLCFCYWLFIQKRRRLENIIQSINMKNILIVFFM